MSKQLSPDVAARVGVMYQWNILQNGKQVEQWTTDFSSPPGRIVKGIGERKPGCTLTLEDDDFALLKEGKLDSMKAFMSGKLKVGGNVMLAQKLKVLFEQGASQKATAVR